MRRKGIWIGLLFLIILSTTIALAQIGADFDLSWWTVDSGGGTSSSGPYALTGAIGQPDADAVLQGGDYAVFGGFLSDDRWIYKIFPPLVQR